MPKLSESRLQRIRLSDPKAVADTLVEQLRTTVRQLRLRGVVVAVSGGIDSATCLAIAARAFGPERTVGLFLPDQHSGSESQPLAQEVCDRFGIPLEVLDITPALAALGCYDWQNRAVTARVPDFDPAVDRFRVDFHQNFADPRSLPSFGLTVVRADGAAERHSLTGSTYLELVAATNMKQRTRMLMTHFHAEARNWAVVGTSNRLEIEQGFFVRYGDGTGDYFPLRERLKSQVYQLAEVLDVPASILGREPTTDTYSAPQSQEDFFYGMPLLVNDAIWDAFAAGEPADRVAADVDEPVQWVEAVYAAYGRRQALAQRLTVNALQE
jgi:NAD+ synthase